jgi:hypothetical protein
VPHQLKLLDRHAPRPDVWERLNDEQRTTVIDTMARVIGKAVAPRPNTTTATDETQEKIHE